MGHKIIALAFVSVMGCSVGGGRDAGGVDGTSGGAIRVDPPDVVMDIGGAPIVIEYRAYLDGREVTNDVTWSSDVAALGAFSGSTFTAAGIGGRTTIRARMGTLEGYTSLTLRASSTIVDPSAPPDAPARFEAATPDASIAPELVYPNDEVMVPPNLRELEFHYRQGGATIFELHFETPGGDVRLYFGCPESVGGGCVYTPDRAAWDALSTSARGTGEITYRLRGIDGTGRLGETAPRRITVAEEDITGGLYYWNASAGTINRFEFGVPGAQAERYLDTGRTGAFMCVGCHALSRDGTRILVGTDTPTTTLQVFDVATRTRIFSRESGSAFPPNPQQPNFSSFSPDSTQIVGSSLEGLHIFDAASGNMVAGPFGGGAGSMPDWSPDGDHIVYVAHDAMSPPGFDLYDVTSVTSGRIATLVRSGTTWTEGPVLRDGGGNNYYPAYSPDGQWVVYVNSPSNTASIGGDPSSAETAYVADAALYLIRGDGTGVAMRLERADGLADSWPKWDPTLYRDSGRDIFWLSWASRRAFGLRYGELEHPQIWMAAIDPSRSGDASYPAFRLPFQDIATGNHIPQWTTTVQRQSCSTDVDCGGEFCVSGRCYAEVPLI